MFGSFPPSPLVGLRLQSLLGPGSRHCYGIITLIHSQRATPRVGSPPSPQLENWPGAEARVERVPAPPSSPKDSGTQCILDANDSDHPSQARKAPSAAAIGGFYPHCPSPPRWPPDSREVAVRFHDRRPACAGLPASARFNGPVDICYAQRASDRDGRDAASCFEGGTTVPLRSNPGLGSAPAACRDRNGVRSYRITSLFPDPNCPAVILPGGGPSH